MRAIVLFKTHLSVPESIKDRARNQVKSARGRGADAHAHGIPTPSVVPLLGTLTRELEFGALLPLLSRIKAFGNAHSPTIINS